MAYITAEQANTKRLALKAAFPTWRFGVTVRNHSTLTVTIQLAPIDLVANILESGGGRSQMLLERIAEVGYTELNPHNLDWSLNGEALDALLKIRDIGMAGNHDNSDSASDYFDVGWYFYIKIGQHGAPFVCKAAPAIRRKVAEPAALAA
jgi:hypothetical protein